MTPFNDRTDSTAAYPDGAGLAALAADLKDAAGAGPSARLLKGKDIGLLCDDPTRPEAWCLYRAGIALGARVALVRPRFDELELHTGGCVGEGIGDGVGDMARMLGRLYDAVACVGLAPSLVRRLRAEAGVPVLDEAAICVAAEVDAPPSAAGAGSLAFDDRCYLWQAALVASFR